MKSNLIYIFLLLGACNPISWLKEKANECHEVEDIYYFEEGYKTQSYFTKTANCPYTLNPLPRYYPTRYIKRGDYDDYKEEYESYGLEFPYKPKRQGKEGVLYPIRK